MLPYSPTTSLLYRAVGVALLATLPRYGLHMALEMPANVAYQRLRAAVVHAHDKHRGPVNTGGWIERCRPSADEQYGHNLLRNLNSQLAVHRLGTRPWQRNPRGIQDVAIASPVHAVPAF